MEELMENKRNPVAEIAMELGGVIRVELYPDKAPLSVANFVALAREGFYDGLRFHRVVRDFMIQGGSANNTCASPPCGFRVKGEFRDNGVNTGLGHVRGAISMARSMHPDSAGTQFFIVHKDAPFLDGQYAAFGMVLDGFEVLDRVAAVPTGSEHAGNPPLEPQTIQKISIQSGDYELPEDLGRLPE